MTDYALQGMLMESVVQNNQTPEDLLDGAWSGLRYIKEFSPGDYIKLVLFLKFELGSAHSPTVTVTLQRGSVDLVSHIFSPSGSPNDIRVEFEILCRQGGLDGEVIAAVTPIINGQTSYTKIGDPVNVDALVEDDFKVQCVTDVGTTTVTCVGAVLLYP